MNLNLWLTWPSKEYKDTVSALEAKFNIWLQFQFITAGVSHKSSQTSILKWKAQQMTDFHLLCLLFAFKIL